MTASALDRRAAASIVEDALGAVFEPAVVRQLREDSPLSMLGMVPSDAVCLSDAIAHAADAAGLECDLGDATLGGAVTVADLVSAVQDAARRTGEELG
jgi:hypothetical protein